MEKNTLVGFGFGLLAGAVIGGTLALLFAPRTGKETRQLIKDKSTEVVNSAREKADMVMDTVKETASEANRKGHAAIYAIKN